MTQLTEPQGASPTNGPVPLEHRQVLAATLPAQSLRRSHSIDYVGAGLLAAVLSALTLVADTGGTAFPRPSGLVPGLIALFLRSRLAMASSTLISSVGMLRQAA